MIVREGKKKKGVLGKINRCECCKEMFISNRSTAKWCSNNCKIKGYRNRKNKALIQQIKAKYKI
jgi:hypothetical protein